MANLALKRIKLQAKKFNKQRTKLALPGTYAWLLINSGQTGTYKKIYILHDWTHEYRAFRNQTNVKISSTLPVFIASLRRASHISINGEVYQIEKRDVAPPEFKRPWWEFYCTKNGERFTEV